MKQGLEGGIIKDWSLIYKDGTAKKQLKLKLVISAEVRVTGFIEGKKGTKRENTFGSLIFENDEGTIKGSTSGFTDKMLEEINSNRDSWIGRVIEVEFNDITKSRDSETYAFSHPRFIADRSDEKNSTDTLERCQEMKEMAMNLS
jgi:ATP-dependent DNA ligase